MVVTPDRTFLFTCNVCRKCVSVVDCTPSSLTNDYHRDVLTHSSCFITEQTVREIVKHVNMASFLEELWNSIFTPGTTPTLLIATNASFGALQFLLLILFLATYSIHFIILSVLSASLWYAINWFARELRMENEKAAAKEEREKRQKSPEAGSDTETEGAAQPSTAQATGISKSVASTLPKSVTPDEDLKRRRSAGDSSGYVSTDSEWEKVSESGNKK